MVYGVWLESLRETMWSYLTVKKKATAPLLVDTPMSPLSLKLRRMDTIIMKNPRPKGAPHHRFAAAVLVCEEGGEEGAEDKHNTDT